MVLKPVTVKNPKGSLRSRNNYPTQVKFLDGSIAIVPPQGTIPNINKNSFDERLLPSGIRFVSAK